MSPEYLIIGSLFLMLLSSPCAGSIDKLDNDKSACLEYILILPFALGVTCFFSGCFWAIFELLCFLIS